MWLTDEKNPASAYAHQCRTGVASSTQSRIAFVGQIGETNTGGRLLATVSVLRKQANPTSRALIVKRRSGSRWPTGAALWAPSGAATRNPRAEADTAEPSDRPAIQPPPDEFGRRARRVDRLSALLIPGAATMVDAVDRSLDKPARYECRPAFPPTGAQGQPDGRVLRWPGPAQPGERCLRSRPRRAGREG